MIGTHSENLRPVSGRDIQDRLPSEKNLDVFFKKSQAVRSLQLREKGSERVIRSLESLLPTHRLTGSLPFLACRAVHCIGAGGSEGLDSLIAYPLITGTSEAPTKFSGQSLSFPSAFLSLCRRALLLIFHKEFRGLGWKSQLLVGMQAELELNGLANESLERERCSSSSSMKARSSASELVKRQGGSCSVSLDGQYGVANEKITDWFLTHSQGTLNELAEGVHETDILTPHEWLCKAEQYQKSTNILVIHHPKSPRWPALLGPAKT
ncbi:hypothetical protein NC653_022856 [Populus alba x Populus x berolinensis]|uniref:Uncharacterized protein n=1 Tax=Populus alba x Populus x berolinensis TaxID=444605 RepID=A0AAD6QA63_9ROSI|nr:hypothetical protein NC653_022856 [Populus alba x Populus x berolinensis]